jgi:hypothetical protein
VTWIGDAPGGPGIFARQFSAAGTPLGEEFRVNTCTTAAGTPSVAVAANGSFVVVWQRWRGGANTYVVAQLHGVFGQRFAPDLIFRDGFDAGTLGAWSAASTDGGDLAVSTLAAMKLTTAGLRALVDDTAALYVQDDTPDDEGRYRVRFYFDTNGFDPGEAQGRFRTRLFIAFEENPTRRLAAVVLRRQQGAYSVRGRLRRADGSQLDSIRPDLRRPALRRDRLEGRGGATGLARDGRGRNTDRLHAPAGEQPALLPHGSLEREGRCRRHPLLRRVRIAPRRRIRALSAPATASAPAPPPRR